MTKFFIKKKSIKFGLTFGIFIYAIYKYFVFDKKNYDIERNENKWNND